MRRLLGLDQRGVQCVALGAERGIDLAAVLASRNRAAEEIDHAQLVPATLFGACQRLVGGERGLAESLDVLQSGALRAELVLFVLAQSGALDLGQLMAQHVLQARRFALFSDEPAM